MRPQPWAAVIVAVTVTSYVPITVIITERRGAVRKRMNALDNAREARATDMLLNYEVGDARRSGAPLLRAQETRKGAK